MKINLFSVKGLQLGFFLSLLLVFFYGNVAGQTTTLANFKFENNLIPESGAIGNPTITTSTNATVVYYNGVTGQAASFASSNTKYFDLVMATTGYNNITISFAGRSSASSTSWVVTGDSSGGTNTTAITSLSVPNGSFSTLTPFPLDTVYSNKASIRIRITASGNATMRLDDLIITGTSMCTASNLTFSSNAVTHNIGDANFTIVPTSNSTGAISYSSSNSTVATVNTSTGEVTIGSTPGTTTITASQVAAGGYCAGTATYTLTVNAVNPILSLTGNSSLGNSCIGIPLQATYTLKNDGTIATGINITSNDSHFVVSGAPASLAANSSATFTVTYTPNSTGTNNAVISAQATTGNTATINISGSGIGHTDPTVTTNLASNVVNTKARLNGNFSADGVCPTVTEKGFVFAKTTENNNPIAGGANVTKSIVSGSSVGTYLLDITGLSPNTGYSYKAYVYDGANYYYGSLSTFTTLSVATQLVFNPAPPTSGSASTNLTTFKVEARRADNSLDTEYSAAIILSGNAISGTGTLVGTTSVNASAGVSTFSAAQFNDVGTYTITASSGSLTTVTSDNIVISIANSPIAAWVNPTATSWYGSTSSWSTNAFPTSSQIAQFNNVGSGSISINLNTDIPVILGIEMSSARTTDLTIGGNGGSSQIVKVVSLNGGIINLTPNVILRNASNKNFTLQPQVSGSNYKMSLALGNTTNNIINIDGSGDIIISSVITGANPLTKGGTGTGILQLTGSNTYTGLTTVNTGTLQLNKSGGALPSTNSVVVNNSGKLQISDNQTLAKLTVATGGNIIVDSGKTLTISDTFTLDTGTQISGGGTIAYASGKLIYTGSSTIIAGIEWPTSSAPSSVNINTGATVILDADKTTTTILTIDGTLNAAAQKISGTGTVNINGTLITTNLNGLLGTGATFTGATPVLGTASTIEYAATSGTQNISAAPNYTNVTFSGGGTKKIVNATENILGTVLIKDNTIVDASGATFGSSDTSLTMLDSSRLIVGAGTDPKPRMGNVYNLSPASIIEFTGNSTSIRLQNTKAPVTPIAYSNIIVSGTGVSNESTVSGINFRSGGSFVVKSGATFKLKNSNGFTGDVNTAISNANNSNNSSLVTLELGSTIQYNGTDQTITNNLAYSNITISGSGTKTATVGNLVVNNITSVTAGTLLIPKSDNDVAANVLYAHKGISTTGGNLILENNAQLLQDDNADNTNAQIQSQRYIAEMDNIPTRLDFVYWSSPVTGQPIKSFSPTTAANCFLQYRESDDKFTITADTDFQVGKGYAIGAESDPADSSPVQDHPNAYAKTYKFSGIPNNGEQSFANLKWTNSDHGYNLVGNPYPSNINFDSLYALNNNESTKKIYNTAWFWTNITYTPTQMGSNYEGNNYATYNGTGGTPPTYDHASYTPNLTPNGIIKVGQAFIVQAKSTGKDQPLNFNNSIRVADKGVFFQKSTEKNRFWLTMESPDKIVNTLLIGYVPGATNGFDQDFDSDLFVVGSDSFYSVLGASKLAIQGRSEVFSVDDVVPLGNVCSVNGIYTISLQNPEGFFKNTQRVYLKDNLLNKYIDLSSLGSYTFTVSKGTDENRFQVVYKDNTSLSTSSIDKLDFEVFRKDNSFVLRSSHNLGNVDLYDAGGKLVMKTFATQKEFLLDASGLPSGVYIIRAENSGNVRSRKIIR